MGGHKLVELADLLDSLSLIPAEVAKEVADEINAQILAMGRPGGPLRGGNAVKARVVAEGGRLVIRGVFPDAGLRRSWVTAIEKVVAEALRKKLGR